MQSSMHACMHACIHALHVPSPCVSIHHGLVHGTPTHQGVDVDLGVRVAAGKHDKQQSAHAPHVHGQRVGLVVDGLGGDVAGRAHHALDHLASLDERGQAKVYVACRQASAKGA